MLSWKMLFDYDDGKTDERTFGKGTKAKTGNKRPA